MAELLRKINVLKVERTNLEVGAMRRRKRPFRLGRRGRETYLKEKMKRINDSSCTR